MNKILFTLFLCLSSLFAQTHVSTKFPIVSDSVKWGSVNDSVGTLHVRYFAGNFQRDSLGTWVASDSCSLPIYLNQDPMLGVTYELRGVADSTNITDSSTRIAIRPYTRYCQSRYSILNASAGGSKSYWQCDAYVKALTDTATISRFFFGSTGNNIGVQTKFSPIGGNSMKLCITSVNVSTTSGKFLPFKNFVIRGN